MGVLLTVKDRNQVNFVYISAPDGHAVSNNKQIELGLAKVSNSRFDSKDFVVTTKYFLSLSRIWY